MRPRRASTGLATLLALASSIPGDAAGQQEGSWFFGDVSFPSRVDRFLAVGTQRWPDPGRGTVLRYSTELAPEATIDVHVQPLPGGRDDPDAIRQEFQRTVRDLRAYARDGVSVDVDTVHTLSVEAGGWTYPGHRVEARVRGPGARGRLVAYVFAKPPSFVKVRITHDAALESLLEPRIEAFLRGILLGIESFQGAGSPSRRP